MVVEKVFAVIAESTRRDLLEALAQESKSVGQLVDELGVSQPTVSKHLRVLREAGVVTMRAQGQKRYYLINTEPLALVSTWLETLGATGAARAASTTAGAATSAVVSAPGAAPVVKLRPAATAAPAVPAPAVPAAAVVSAPVVAPEPARQLVPAAAGTDSHMSDSAVAASHVTDSEQLRNATAVVPFDSVHSGVAQPNEYEGGVPGQISRSMGRAANKAADLLANLPALPAFKRRKS
ncbi:ArsR/SmtB family transcription factor [Arthrobacter psychrochitiniphilus]|uniref:Transcriptional regulator n=1 Tax=Arthrobacter psychrochitiniphilus TaxID=291045 RepID=A0A2V3DTS6_9MICC|nr:metalloregulator ArsR/SmtB family transcription factor [Arthrobacter psychrochitiniphilus]NYG15717.1 DNA-binding transcriptional ArsR family regulator [Arthrobacter psychrochitiniphilus]PXA66817.1 transcriptional regulator [Arthrobacter psychrochitiniphilus]